MRRSLLSVLLLFLITAKINAQNENKVLSVYKQVYEKLAALRFVSYHFKRELNYPSQGFHDISQGNMYLEFGNDLDIAGFRFMARYDKGVDIYNNAELFTLNEDKKTLNIQHIIKIAQLNGRSPLFQGIPMLRNNLPMIIADTSVKKHLRDSVVNDKSCYVLQFYLHNKIMNYYTGNSYDLTTQDILFDNKIIVDRSSLLPIAVVQISVANNDINRSDISEINIDPETPKETSCYYSSYTDKYKIITPGKPLELIKAGAIAPDFELINYKTNISENLARYKGKVVMLEFWIKNCGPCIEHVPDLNNIDNGYKGKPFQLLAINSLDSKTNVGLFMNKNAVSYSVLYGNKINVAKEYGVQGFPMVVIIDKAGVVIYSGELDIPKIRSVINAAI